MIRENPEQPSSFFSSLGVTGAQPAGRNCPTGLTPRGDQLEPAKRIAKMGSQVALVAGVLPGLAQPRFLTIRRIHPPSSQPQTPDPPQNFRDQPLNQNSSFASGQSTTCSFPTSKHIAPQNQRSNHPALGWWGFESFPALYFEECQRLLPTRETFCPGKNRISS